jgi:restriction system protein
MVPSSDTMARHRSFIVSLERAARAAARIQREREAAGRREARDALRNQREALRLKQVRDRFAKERHYWSRQEEAQALTRQVSEQVVRLQSVLADRETSTPDVVFDSLRTKDPPPVPTVPETLRRAAPEPTRESFTNRVNLPGLLEKLFRTGRYERELHQAEERYCAEEVAWRGKESQRQAELVRLEQEHQRAFTAYEERVAHRDKEVNEFVERVEQSDIESVVAYFELILERSDWPDEFPQEYRVAYEPGPRQLVVDFELPTVGIIPVVVEYRYVKARDAIDPKSRKPAEIKELYREIVASTTLRCIHECFAADTNVIDVLTFNGFVHTLDPATGNPIRPYLISVRVTKERFQAITLDHVDTKACLRNLGAQVSPQPAELVPVRPIIEFDMVDKRFIGEKNVVSELDARPNLMDLTPTEFEALVGNLFTRMGVETKLTRTSRDGGVDAIAFDSRPILGGKVVIQAKRYSHTVGVSAVRDLYGTMMNEGANKGILVTTSSYGPDAYDFCKDKPVELIDGSGLLYHLEQVGVHARIIFPTDQPPTNLN